MKTAREVLAAYYQEKTAAGLVDVKYLVSNASEATTEQVCGEVNAMHDALVRQEFKAYDLGTQTINC